MTKIVGVSMVRDECDVIEVFVRHALESCDELLVTDHRSSDGTFDILSALRDEGLPIHILRDERVGLHQADTMERIIRRAAQEHGADWVVPIDADEFIVATGDLQLRDVLERADEEPIQVPWRTYVPCPEDEAAEPNVLLRIQHRLTQEKQTFYKVLIPRECALRRDVFISAGNHRLLVREGRRKERKWSAKNSDELLLAHFPVRSESQLIRKVVVSLPTHLSTAKPRPKFGFQAQLLFERLRKGGELSRTELRDIAFAYPSREAVTTEAGAMVHDPVPVQQSSRPTRYWELEREEPVWALAEVAISLAEELSILRTREQARDSGLIRRLVARFSSLEEN